MLYCIINIKRVEEKNIVAKFKKVFIEQQDTHTYMHKDMNQVKLFLCYITCSWKIFVFLLVASLVQNRFMYIRPFNF